MIREVCLCPYCSSSVAIDCQHRKVVFDPDRPSGEPCSHLVCYWICLSYSGRGGKKLTKSSIWEIGRGAHDVNIRTSAKDAGLTNYFIDYSFDRLPRELIPRGKHRIAGDSAAQREEKNPGSGEFEIKLKGLWREALLDGWAIYAPEPAAVLAELDEVAFQYEA
jgi:hypothetical protein